MSPIAVLFWVLWIIWVFFGVRRNYPVTGPFFNAGQDIVLVVIMLIIGLVLFPVRL